MIRVLSSIYIAASSAAPFFPVVTETSSVLIAPGVTNSTVTATNRDVVYAANDLAAATFAKSYSMAIPTNFVLDHISEWTPSVSRFNGIDGFSSQTNGFAGFTIVGRNTNGQLRYCSLSLNCSGYPGGWSTNFVQFLPGSFGAAMWSHWLSWYPGRSNILWSTYDLTGTNATLAWDTNSIAYSLTGHTAISQCSTFQSVRGQIPVTALTKRHGYTRGHGMGGTGLRTDLAGHNVFFCTGSNTVVRSTVTTNVWVEDGYGTGSGQDFTVILFAADLPDSIQPMRVIYNTNRYAILPRHYPYTFPWPEFAAEQTGRLVTYMNQGTILSGFEGNAMKGGDSGSPWMMMMPSELVFLYGSTTTGPSALMQQKMDELSTAAGLNPANYQLQYYDISSYPSYP